MLDFISQNRLLTACLMIIGISLLSLLPVKLNLRFFRKTNELKIQAIIWIWVIPLRINIVNPLTSFFWNLSVKKPWQKKPPQDLPVRDIPWRSFIKRSLSVTKVGKKTWERTNRFFIRIKQPVSIENLKVYVEIGWRDAACTAITVGVAWSLLGCMYSLLTTQFKMLSVKNDFSVIPNFQNDRLCNIDASCIIGFRLGHIIIVIYQILRSAQDIYNIIRRASV